MLPIVLSVCLCVFAVYRDCRYDCRRKGASGKRISVRLAGASTVKFFPRRTREPAADIRKTSGKTQRVSVAQSLAEPSESGDQEQSVFLSGRRYNVARSGTADVGNRRRGCRIHSLSPIVGYAIPSLLVSAACSPSCTASASSSSGKRAKRKLALLEQQLPEKPQYDGQRPACRPQFRRGAGGGR